jgi:quinol monooxygenase YgiN
MQTHISWHVELSVTRSQFDAFRRLTQSMTEHAASEPGVLIYERFWNDEDNSIHLYERYVDSNTALLHLDVFDRAYRPRFSALIKRRRFEVFGDPSNALKARLDEFGASYFRPLV